MYPFSNDQQPERIIMPDENDVRPKNERRDTTGLMIALAGLALALMVQFAGTIWWGATMSADLRHLTEAFARIDGERYTKSDASRDIQRLDQRDALISEQHNDLRARVARLEDKGK